LASDTLRARTRPPLAKITSSVSSASTSKGNIVEAPGVPPWH